MGANDAQFGYLKRSLESAKNLGRDEYPVTLQGAYELLLNTFWIFNNTSELAIVLIVLGERNSVKKNSLRLVLHKNGQQ